MKLIILKIKYMKIKLIIVFVIIFCIYIECSYCMASDISAFDQCSANEIKILNKYFHSNFRWESKNFAQFDKRGNKVTGAISINKKNKYMKISYNETHLDIIYTNNSIEYIDKRLNSRKKYTAKAFPLKDLLNSEEFDPKKISCYRLDDGHGLDNILKVLLNNKVMQNNKIVASFALDTKNHLTMKGLENLNSRDYFKIIF